MAGGAAQIGAAPVTAALRAGQAGRQDGLGQRAGGGFAQHFGLASGSPEIDPNTGMAPGATSPAPPPLGAPPQRARRAGSRSR